MNESRRQTQLAELGIMQWYARTPLPGAAPSPRFEFATSRPSSASPAVAAETPPQSGPISAPRPEPRRGPSVSSPTESRQNLRSIRDSLTGGEAESPSQEAAVTNESPVVSKRQTGHTEAVAVSLCVAEGVGLSVLADFSGDFSEGLQSNLLQNILRALGVTPKEPSLQRFRWPVFSNPDVPGNDQNGLIDAGAQFLNRESDHRWLVLGPEARQLVALCEAHDRVWHEGDDKPGLLAADPEAKRLLWRSLQEKLRAAPLTQGPE